MNLNGGYGDREAVETEKMVASILNDQEEEMEGSREDAKEEEEKENKNEEYDNLRMKRLLQFKRLKKQLRLLKEEAALGAKELVDTEDEMSVENDGVEEVIREMKVEVKDEEDVEEVRNENEVGEMERLVGPDSEEMLDYALEYYEDLEANAVFDELDEEECLVVKMKYITGDRFLVKNTKCWEELIGTVGISMKEARGQPGKEADENDRRETIIEYLEEEDIRVAVKAEKERERVREIERERERARKRERERQREREREREKMRDSKEVRRPKKISKFRIENECTLCDVVCSKPWNTHRHMMSKHRVCIAENKDTCINCARNVRRMEEMDMRQKKRIAEKRNKRIMIILEKYRNK